MFVAAAASISGILFESPDPILTKGTSIETKNLKDSESMADAVNKIPISLA